jgi:hypothetical protein
MSTKVYCMVAFLVLSTFAAMHAWCAAGDKTNIGKKANDKATSQTKASETADSKKIVELGNANCPITGEKVGSMQKDAHVDYKGVRVGLCCSGCKSKFMANPDANLKKATESVPKDKK